MTDLTPPDNEREKPQNQCWLKPECFEILIVWTSDIMIGTLFPKKIVDFLSNYCNFEWSGPPVLFHNGQPLPRFIVEPGAGHTL